MSEPHAISWMPSWAATADLARFEVAAAGRDAGPGWRCLRPRPDGWAAFADGLRKAGSALRAMPVADIIDAIDRTAERWGDRSWPLRRSARDDVVRATGFSPEAVERSFDVELRNYRADSLWRVLRRELGDPAVLDGFRPDAQLAGCGMAIGPRVTLAVFTGNVPGLPALSIVRALLVKSAVIAKVASGEPTFAAHFARSLFEADPRLGDALVVTYWEREDADTLAAALDCADAVIAYGGAEAVRAIRTAARDHQLFVEHGPKVSVGVVSEAYRRERGDAELAECIARDVSAFNQHACIAPQAYLVEGEPAELRSFAERVAAALEAYRLECPLGELADADAAALQMRRAIQAWRAGAEPGCELWQPDGPDWTLALDRELPGDAGSGNRFLRLIPVPDLGGVVEQLRPLGRHLQNVALGVADAELPALAGDLALLGASRICEPGRMVDPSMMWRHDGRMCVAELLRWCDIEMHEYAARAAASD